MAGVIFTDNAGQSPDEIEFPAGTPTEPNRNLIAEGSYVIVSNYTPDATVNGQIYRVGRAIDEANGQWELLPGFDLQQTSLLVKPLDPGGATVFVLGKQLQDPENDYDESTNLVEGLTQDISVYQSKIIAP
jgi:hypothetical protein